MRIKLRIKLWWWLRTVPVFRRCFYMYCMYNENDEIYAEISDNNIVVSHRKLATSIQGPMTLFEAMSVYRNIQPFIRQANQEMWLAKGSKS